MKKIKNRKIIIIVIVFAIIFLLVWIGYFYPKAIFHDNERELAKAGKRYFEVNSRTLPKENGRVLSVRLETLIKQKYIEEDLTIPNATCDIKESTVRVRNDNGSYNYYTYLKCGSFESNVDHKAPVITLNGENKITMSKGEKYQEAGIKSIIDDVDGVIDNNKAVIKGSVNTNKIGTYTITYTAKDRLDNSSTVTRTVEVIENLSNTIGEVTQTSNGVFKGLAENNYLMFNNMLFRIVRINSDKSILVVSDNSLFNVDFGGKRYTGSSLDEFLNTYFYSLLEKENQDMIVESKWCDDEINSDYMKTECSRYSEKRKIGILALEDYNNSLNNGESYLDDIRVTWYMNFNKEGNPWVLSTLYDYPNRVAAMDKDYLFNVKPAFTLKENVKIYDGNGTIDDPYIVREKEKIKRGASLNTREVGEYVSYSGYLFQIAKTEKEGSTELILDGVLGNYSNFPSIKYDNEGQDKIYNPKEKGNIGYQINQSMSEYIDTSLLENREIDVNIYKKEITYKGKHDTKKYKVRLSAPSTFTIFSAQKKNSASLGFWLRDSSYEKNKKVMIYPAGTTTYDYASDSSKASVKVSIFFDKDVYIKEGEGTKEKPFEVKK